MANPVLSRDPNFKASPSFGGGNPYEVQRAITVESVLQKAVISSTLLIAAAAVGWIIASPILMIVASIAALVIVIVSSFKREPSRALTLAYAGLEGLALGGLSVFYENAYSGIVLQAVLGTFAVLAVTLVLFRFTGFRATAKTSRIVLIALIGYTVYALINFGLVAFGVIHDPFGLDGSVLLFGIPLGVILGIFAVLMGAYFLIEDFTLIENAVQRQADDKFGWTAVMGLLVTLVFIYVHILRILALARR